MRNSVRGVRTAALVLGGASLVATLSASLAGSAVAAVPPATVSSSESAGVQIRGSVAGDNFVLTRGVLAGTLLIHIDAAAPLEVLGGCRPAVGDATRALCLARFDQAGLLRPVTVRGGLGDDSIGHGASPPIPLIVTGDSGRDAINGGPAQDSLHGGDDNDSIRGGDGNDRISGGLGQDRVSGEGDNDYLSGNSFELVGPNPSNADGLIDLVNGQDGHDHCIRSVADPDTVENCEVVLDA